MIMMLLLSSSERAFALARNLARLPAQLIASQDRKRAARSAVAELAELDDRLLTDIGLFRTDIEEIARRLSIKPTGIADAHP